MVSAEILLWFGLYFVLFAEASQHLNNSTKSQGKGLLYRKYNRFRKLRGRNLNLREERPTNIKDNDYEHLMNDEKRENSSQQSLSQVNENNEELNDNIGSFSSMHQQINGNTPVLLREYHAIDDISKTRNYTGLVNSLSKHENKLPSKLRFLARKTAFPSSTPTAQSESFKFNLPKNREKLQTSNRAIGTFQIPSKYHKGDVEDDSIMVMQNRTHYSNGNSFKTDGHKYIRRSLLTTENGFDQSQLPSTSRKRELPGDYLPPVNDFKMNSQGKVEQVSNLQIPFIPQAHMSSSSRTMFVNRGGLRKNNGISGGRIGGMRIGQQNFDGGPGMPYEFEWSVLDAETGNDFSHRQSSDGDVTEGQYEVLLPDGRKQIVRFRADAVSGYQADVTYEGEANFNDIRPTRSGFSGVFNTGRNSGRKSWD